jgi:hypothetical protein
MILGKFKNSPEKTIPVAMALIVVGLSILAIGIAWPHFSPSVPHLGTDWNDFARGFLFGLAIAMEVSGVVIAATAAASASKKRNHL